MAIELSSSEKHGGGCGHDRPEWFKTIPVSPCSALTGSAPVEPYEPQGVGIVHCLRKRVLLRPSLRSMYVPNHPHHFLPQGRAVPAFMFFVPE